MLKDDIFVLDALYNTAQIQWRGKTYLDFIVAQRLEGPSNAGSSYPDITADELLKKIFSAKWQETSHPEIKDDSRVFKASLPGLQGVLPLDSLPDNVVLYAIDPKHTSYVSIGAAGIPKKPVPETYLITRKDIVEGKKLDIISTFHPGEPVTPSQIKTRKLPDGTRLTKEQAAGFGFRYAKFMLPEMVAKYEIRK